MDQRTICAGIQRSGPIHLETSCEGSSAHRKLSLKTVFPQLKSISGQVGFKVLAMRLLTVGVHSEIFEKVICDSLGYIGPV